MTESLDLGYATLDLDRARRQGLPEVVYAPGKTPAEIDGIVTALLAHDTGPVLVTRLGADAAAALTVSGGDFDETAGVLVWRSAARRPIRVAVVTAGTADGPVAAEAGAVAAAIGLDVTQIRDVGVAGLHRVTARIADLRAADIVIVIAGMEGALASVVAGLVAAPVVAVPTSTGYGAALDGITALLAMLSSCANGVTVVNIDSGFSAAMAAHRLATVIEAGRVSR
jgi:pyridinium-3,5-biscarboxylic acid mononucleotide synthase